jgi:hypothetical protein
MPSPSHPFPAGIDQVHRQAQHVMRNARPAMTRRHPRALKTAASGKPNATGSRTPATLGTSPARRSHARSLSSPCPPSSTAPNTPRSPSPSPLTSRPAPRLIIPLPPSPSLLRSSPCPPPPPPLSYQCQRRCRAMESVGWWPRAPLGFVWEASLVIAALLMAGVASTTSIVVRAASLDLGAVPM